MEEGGRKKKVGRRKEGGGGKKEDGEGQREEGGGRRRKEEGGGKKQQGERWREEGGEKRKEEGGRRRATGRADHMVGVYKREQWSPRVIEGQVWGPNASCVTGTNGPLSCRRDLSSGVSRNDEWTDTLPSVSAKKISR